MLASVGLSSYGFTYDNWGAAPVTSSPGTSVVPGTSNAEGSFTQIASGANISRDVYWIALWVTGGATSASQKDHLLDIGVDPAGGSSYTAIINNIVCGESPINFGAPGVSAASVNGTRQFIFPFYIKSGSSVAVRIQGSNATAGTVRVMAKFYGDPSNPECVIVGQYSETIGTISGSGGVSFTPGTSGAWGSYASLGTTVSDLWWWQLCVEDSQATASLLAYYVELAYGDVTNKVTIKREYIQADATEAIGSPCACNLLFPDSYKPVPAGSTLYVRGMCSGTPVTGWNAVAIGIGG
jgi:hypothetical protein